MTDKCNVGPIKLSANILTQLLISNESKSSSYLPVINHDLMVSQRDLEIAVVFGKGCCRDLQTLVTCQNDDVKLISNRG